MSKLLKIGIVGCGAIGSSLAHSIVSRFSDTAILSGLYDTDLQKARRLADRLNRPKSAVVSVDRLINNADLVVESAQAASASEIAAKVIRSGRDVMIMSVGGIIKDYKRLFLMAHKSKARIYIPSGAICGIDGLKASAEGKIKKVILTTKKPPRAFSGVPYIIQRKIDLANISNDTLLFEGSALSAVKAFPQNINVAAVLSLAGLGPRKTVVRIVACPDISRNVHEIEIESAAGKIFTRTENVVHPENPKTSYLAVLSAVATLRQILNPICIGN